MRPAIPVALALAALAAFWNAPEALAHPGLETREAPVGAAYKAVVKIPHGCAGSATVKVRVQIPEGIIGVKPMLKPGWSIETVRGAYAKAYPYHGAQLSEGVKEVIWTGRLPDDFFDEFTFSGFLTDSLEAGQTVYFPVHQECEKGGYAWIEVPAPGQDAHQLASPALGLKLLPAVRKMAASAASSTTYKTGALVIEAPWARATPRGARVGGAYMKITNTGQDTDRLIGGTLPIAQSVEVHEMTMTGDVMRMRHLDKGLEIKPGESVELKPGGYHIMLMGLTQPMVQGDIIKGTLVFEKAGPVEIEYRVAPLGASEGGGGHSHH